MSSTVPVASPLTASGETGPLVPPESDTADITVTVDVTTVSGSGATATFTATRAADDAYPPSSWDTANAVSTAAITTAGTYTITLPAKVSQAGEAVRYWKLSWVISGTTPSFTVTATAK